MIDQTQIPIFEIRDPRIDTEAIIQLVQDGVRRRQAAGAYSQDPALVGPESLRVTASTDIEASDTYVDIQALHDALSEMMGKAHLSEMTFTSQVPILGRVISVVRSAWSWMAARWIGRHIVVMQTAFNDATVGFGSDLVRNQNAQLWRLQRLQQQVGDIELRLRRLEIGASLPVVEEEEAL